MRTSRYSVALAIAAMAVVAPIAGAQGSATTGADLFVGLLNSEVGTRDRGPLTPEVSNLPAEIPPSDVRMNVIPEPASMVLMATGLAGLVVVARRKKA